MVITLLVLVVVQFVPPAMSTVSPCPMAIGLESSESRFHVVSWLVLVSVAEIVTVPSDVVSVDTAPPPANVSVSP